MRRFFRRLGDALRTQWEELGSLGRAALAGIVVSLGVAVVLGFSIPAAAGRHLLEARADQIEATVQHFADRGLVPTRIGEATPEFDDLVRLRLLGGDSVRVKVWNLDGTIVYSDVPELIGDRFGFSHHAVTAPSGERSIGVSRLEEPENASEREFGQLLEFYFPVFDANGEVFAVFEVYQTADSYVNTVSRIRRNVWLSIGSGLGFLALFMGALTLAVAGVANRGRRQAEALLSALSRAQEVERKRTVGALHDDIGQPLYRLLYGLEGCKARLAPGDPVREELERLEVLVRDIDRTLRAELRKLHHGAPDDLGLGPALEELARTISEEGELALEVEVSLSRDPDPDARSALYRAVAEGLLNVRRHAKTSRATVRVVSEDDKVVAEVSDDGVGPGRREGLGIVTTRERLEAVGGGLVVERRRGGGTVFRAWVPATGEDST